MPKIYEIQDRLETLDGVPDNFKSLYVDDGKGGFEYKDPKALKDSMVNAKNEKQALAAKVAEYEARYKDVDPDEFKTLKAKAKDFDEIDKTNKGELDKIRGELKDRYEGTISAKDKQIIERDTRYANHILGAQIEAALAKAGANEAGVKLLATQLRSEISTKMGDDGEPEFRILDKSGKQRLNENADEFTIADLIADHKKSFPQLFGSNAGSGQGAGSQDKNVAVPTDEKPSAWNAAQKQAFIKQHGHEAFRGLLTKEAAAKATERQSSQRKTA